MKKLKKVLLFSLIILIFIIPHNSKYTNENNIEGIINNYKIDGDKLTIELIAKEKISAFYYIKSLNEKNYLIKNIKLGKRIMLSGTLIEPNENTNFNLFNYKKYLLSKKIYWLFQTNNIEIKNTKISLKYKIKNLLKNRIDKSKNNNYLNTFIIGDNELDDNIKESYRNNGISHLFAISGLHITIFTNILFMIFKKKSKISFIIIFNFLIFYMFLTNYSPSVVRSSLLFIIININKLFKTKFKTYEILIFIFLLFLIYNPFYIYNVGFIYSFVISFFLIIFSKEENNYFKSLFNTSLISNLAGMPITIYFFNQINLLSIIINLAIVPLVSFVVFPLCLLNFLFIDLDPIVYIILKLLENVSLFFNKITFFKLTMKSVNILVIIIYYVVVILIVRKLNIKNFLIFIIILLVHHNINYLNIYPTITFLDVGQGDSSLIVLPHNKGNILIDTGGKVSFDKEYWRLRKTYGYAKNVIIPYLKSIGIDHLDYLILTHGDTDHMGDSIELINNFKVNKVIFNKGEYNYLEKDLIKKLKQKKIKYYKNIKNIKIDKYDFRFINNNLYDNENDNSNVIYTKINDKKILLMGDASSKVENELLNNCILNNVDILKVGHHGSRTSSSKIFIDDIKPKYSIISVGKNNRYGHPNKETLINLKKSKIYRTDNNGSISFRFKNNLKIKTCFK